MPQRGQTNWWSVAAILVPLVLFWVNNSKQTGNIEKSISVIEASLKDEHSEHLAKDNMQDARINGIDSRLSVQEAMASEHTTKVKKIEDEMARHPYQFGDRGTIR